MAVKVRLDSYRHAFTVVELLVVISIIVLLISILQPSLGRSRETARRSICASNIRQAIIGMTGIADNAGGALPSGKRNIVSNYAAEHCIWVSDKWHDDVKGAAGGSDALFECVNFSLGFSKQNQYGWVIGYNYLGGHPLMNQLNNFKSPMKITDDPSLPIYVDLNNYTPNGWTFVAHTNYGALNMGGALPYRNNNALGALPRVLGSQGGNVGLLDSSVNWKPISLMEQYYTGEWPASYPCFW